MRGLSRVVVACAVFALPIESAAQENASEPGFAEAVALCQQAMLSRVALADLPNVSEALTPAPPEVREAHPLGASQTVWVLAGRGDANVTVVEPQAKQCSVFATHTPPAAAFDAASLVLTEANAFAEGEVTQRRGGGVQRNFRSADGNVRVELQTFGEGEAGSTQDDVLTMALFGRRR
jgi:hypothetical protein